jgi:hypothetical protein
MASSKKQGMRKRGRLATATKEIDKKNVKGMANALRNQLLAIFNERAASSAELSKELGIDYGEVNYEVGVLREIPLIEKVDEKKKGGVVEVFYRATSRAYLDPAEWLTVADPIKPGMRASLFQNIWVDAVAALSEETYDSIRKPPAHMSWTTMIVDPQGWGELVAILLQALEDVFGVQKDCAERLTADDEEGISCTVSMLGYPGAVDKRKVGPPINTDDLASSTRHPRQKGRRAAKKNAAANKAKASAKRGATKASPKPKAKRPNKASGKRKRKDAGK